MNGNLKYTESGFQISLLRPLVHLDGMSNCLIEILIPFKYFKSDLNIVDADRRMIESLSKGMNGEDASIDDILDLNALQREGISPLLSFGNLDSCDFSIHIIPGDVPSVSIVKKT